MKKFENIFIIKNNITEEQRENAEKSIVDFIDKNAKILKKEELGLKTLAYTIRNCKQGYYYIIEFECDGTIIGKLERKYRTTDEIIKFLTIRKDDRNE